MEAWTAPLTTPPAEMPRPGATMYREARDRMVAACRGGASQQRLDALFAGYVREIEAHDPSWSARRMLCVDGTIFYRGEQGPSLIITRRPELWAGLTLPGVITVTGADFASGVLLFQPPVLRAPAATRLAP